MPNSKITLKDIYEVVNRLEEKFDKRLCHDEERIDRLETFKDELTGKLAVVVACFSVGVNIAWDWIKSKLK